MRTSLSLCLCLSLSSLFNLVWKLKFSSIFSTFKLYILDFSVVEFVSVSIVLYSFVIGFILSKSINDSDMYELPEPVSKSAPHLTPFTFLLLLLGMLHQTRYSLTLAKIYYQLIYHVQMYGVFLHFKQVLSLRHSVVLCLASEQGKQKFFIAQYFSTLSHGFCSFTTRRPLVRFLTENAFTLSLFSLVTFAITITSFWISSVTQWYRISLSPLL